MFKIKLNSWFCLVSLALSLTACNGGETSNSSSSAQNQNVNMSSRNYSMNNSTTATATDYLYVTDPITKIISTYSVTNGVRVSAASSQLDTKLKSLDKIVVAPNQKWLFALSSSYGGIKAYTINPDTGQLSNEQFMSDSEQINDIVISPDSRWAYISRHDDGYYVLYMLAINQTTGALSFQKNGGTYAKMKSFNNEFMNSLAVDMTGSYVFAGTNKNTQTVGIMGFPIINANSGTPSINAAFNNLPQNWSYGLAMNHQKPVLYNLMSDGNLEYLEFDSTGRTKSFGMYGETFSFVTSQCAYNYNCNAYITTSPDNSELFFADSSGSIHMTGLESSTGYFIPNSMISVGVNKETTTVPIASSAADPQAMINCHDDPTMSQCVDYCAVTNPSDSVCQQCKNGSTIAACMQTEAVVYYPRTITVDSSNKFLYVLGASDASNSVNLYTYQIQKSNQQQSLTLFGNNGQSNPAINSGTSKTVSQCTEYTNKCTQNLNAPPDCNQVCSKYDQTIVFTPIYTFSMAIAHNINTTNAISSTPETSVSQASNTEQQGNTKLKKE